MYFEEKLLSIYWCRSSALKLLYNLVFTSFSSFPFPLNFCAFSFAEVLQFQLIICLYVLIFLSLFSTFLYRSSSNVILSKNNCDFNHSSRKFVILLDFPKVELAPYLAFYSYSILYSNMYLISNFKWPTRFKIQDNFKRFLLNPTTNTIKK